jgi:hypothetical protein
MSYARTLGKDTESRLAPTMITELVRVPDGETHRTREVEACVGMVVWSGGLDRRRAREAWQGTPEPERATFSLHDPHGFIEGFLEARRHSTLHNARKLAAQYADFGVRG